MFEESGEIGMHQNVALLSTKRPHQQSIGVNQYDASLGHGIPPQTPG